MPTDPFRRLPSDSVRLGPVSLGALIGGVTAFVWSGAIVTVLWVLLGLAVGAGLGFLVKWIAVRDPLGRGNEDPAAPSATAQTPMTTHVLDLDGPFPADGEDHAVLPDGRRTGAAERGSDRSSAP